MRKLITVQTREKLNDVFAVDQAGAGGANHEYKICKKDSDETLAVIKFQNGPRKQVDSTSGVIDTDLLEIVRDRLKAFQDGAFANKYNESALAHVEKALASLNDRVEDRIKRNVLGKDEK